MKRIVLTVSAVDSEAISDELFELGAESVSELPGQLVALCEDSAAIEGRFAKRIVANAELNEDDWKHRWLEHVGGVAVGASVYVHPVMLADEPPAGYAYTLLIDPRDAFGFAHPTTLMCLDALHAELTGRPNRAELSLLDVGTGTGILAILACRMGLTRVAAFDLETEAVEMTRRNMLLNGCDFSVSQADIAGYSAAPAEIVMANLLHNVIRDNLAGLKQLVAPGGLLIASGIIDAHHDELQACFDQHGFRLLRRLRQDGWNAYVLQRIQ